MGCPYQHTHHPPPPAQLPRKSEGVVSLCSLDARFFRFRALELGILMPLTEEVVAQPVGIRTVPSLYALTPGSPATLTRWRALQVDRRWERKVKKTRSVTPLSQMTRHDPGRFFLVPGWALPAGCGPARLAGGCVGAVAHYAQAWARHGGLQHTLTKLTLPLTSTR